jgi:hypothetical protein
MDINFYQSTFYIRVVQLSTSLRLEDHVKAHLCLLTLASALKELLDLSNILFLHY